MLTFQILCRDLPGCQLYIQPEAPSLPVLGIAIACDQPAEPGQCYFGDANSLCLQFASVSEPGQYMAVLCDGSAPDVQAVLFKKGVSFAVTDLNSLEAGNFLMKQSFYFSHWKDRLQQKLFHGASLQELLSDIAPQIRRPIFWLNTGYRLLASDVNYAFEDNYIQEMLLSGYLSLSSINALMENCKTISLQNAGGITAIELFTDTGHYGVMCEVRERGISLGHLLLLSEHSGRDQLLFDYMLNLVSLFQQYAALQKVDSCESEEGLADYLDDLITLKLTDPQIFRERTEKISIPHNCWYQCILIGSQNERGDAVVDKVLLKKLGLIFPQGKIAEYENMILVFLPKSDRHKAPCDETALQTLLSARAARACIGGQTRNLCYFRQVYLQTRSEFLIGMKLRPEQRILHGEDYQIYQIIDLSARDSQSFHGENLVYLCCPRYTELYRHDLEKHDNLCHVLECYIANNCNTTQTAKALFLHRNTLINKIARIEEILGESLDSSTLRLNCMFSASVIEYAEKYRKEDILLQKPPRPLSADEK